MPHMEPQVEYDLYVEVEDSNGETCILPADIVGVAAEGPLTPEALRACRPFMGGEPVGGEARMAWGARLSAPGYMDATDWALSTTEGEAWESLIREYDLCRMCGGDSPDAEYCNTCVPGIMDATIVDTAGSWDGHHDIGDGRAILVTFDDGALADFGPVIVSARYTAPDEEDAIDLAVDALVERAGDEMRTLYRDTRDPSDKHELTDEDLIDLLTASAEAKRLPRHP